MQEVIFHRRTHCEFESVPVRQHVGPNTRAVHDPDSLQRHDPAAEQIALIADARTDALQRGSVKQVGIAGAVFHEFFPAAEFAGNDRLAVDLEILITPAAQGSE